MSISKPFPVQNASVTFGADAVYNLLDALISAGVVGSTDLTVSQRAAGANLSVDVSSGTAFVAFTSPAGGKRQVTIDATTNSGTPGAPNSAGGWLTTFTSPHASLPRIDRVVLTVRDNNLDASGAYDSVLRVIAGTATSGATLTNLTGAAAVPSNSLLLANVLVAASATSITNAQIDSTSGTTRVRASAGSGKAAGVSIPSGLIFPFGGASTAIPAGYLLCDGTAVSRTTYASLFTAIGTNHGTGDGSTTFNLPNFVGKTIVGYDGSQTEFNAIAKTGGAKTVALVTAEMPSHNHGVNDPGHSHNSNASQIVSAANIQSGSGYGAVTPNTSTNTTGITIQNTGSGSAHNNLQPYNTVHYIIKT